MADKIAKEVTKNNHIDLTISIIKAEIKSIIKKRLKERLQSQWEETRKRHWFRFRESGRNEVYREK